MLPPTAPPAPHPTWRCNGDVPAAEQQLRVEEIKVLGFTCWELSRNTGSCWGAYWEPLGWIEGCTGCQWGYTGRHCVQLWVFWRPLCATGRYWGALGACAGAYHGGPIWDTGIHWGHWEALGMATGKALGVGARGKPGLWEL